MPDPQERLHKNESKPGDTRTRFQIDRDRVLYSSALRRLGEVTQVVSASEGHVFHNRLTHSLKVAQIARRIAERLIAARPELPRKVVLDPDAAEAAALAHDLGHPPFGHAAEEELNECLTTEPFGNQESDGFEGNAQSFRIVTRLAGHGPVLDGYDGLDLCRATLDGILKYPYYKREGPDPDKSLRKYGAYRSDHESFEHARPERGNTSCCLVASIMNHADDVTYSVHDLDDFFRAGLVPLEVIHHDGPLTYEIEEFKKGGKVALDIIERGETELRKWVQKIAPRDPFLGTRLQRRALRRMSSDLIDEFVSTPKLVVDEQKGTAELAVPEMIMLKMRFLQSLVWRYVITSPRLATQQFGQRRIVRELFSAYANAIWNISEDKPWKGDLADRKMSIVPVAFRDLAEETRVAATGLKKVGRMQAIGRLAADIVSSLTEQQALVLHRRMTGVDPGRIAIVDA